MTSIEQTPNCTHVLTNVCDSPECSGTATGSAPVVTIQLRTDAIVRGLQIVLTHHRASLEVLVDLRIQVQDYLDDSQTESGWMKRAKYLLTYPIASYLRNELPPQPDVVFEPSGVLSRWMRPRLKCFNRRNTHLWYSWLQAKRSALPVSAELVDKAYCDHLTTLTLVDPVLGSNSVVYDQIRSNPAFLGVLDKVRKDFHRNLEDQRDILHRPASSSACFEKTRAKDGQLGALRSKCGIPDHHFTTELSMMRLFPKVYDGDIIRYNVVLEVRRPPHLENWLDLVQSRSLKDVEGKLHCILENSLFDFDAIVGSTIKCTIQAILEPMKVRIISKGESVPYYRMNNFQKALHSSLKSLDCFRLIGRPLSPCDIVDLARKSSSGDVWFSIDYSGATDGLSASFSRFILDYLLDNDGSANISWDEASTARRVLGLHELFYPMKFGDTPISDEFLNIASTRGRDSEKDTMTVVHAGFQTNGQLMGSILSFPILCLANLAVYLFVTEDYHRGWTLNQRLTHVLVNGDDMVYAAPENLWQQHVEAAGVVGLKMSVGKAYHHPIYLNINSTSVHYNLNKKCPLGLPEYDLPYQIDFLNTGLIVGQSKVMNTEDDEFTGLCVNINRILKGSLPYREKDLLCYILRYKPEEIRAECEVRVRIPLKHGYKERKHIRNLFLPLQLGGMGVNPPPNFRYRLTKTDRQIATSLIRSSQLPISFGLPLPANEPAKFDPNESVSWYKKTDVPDLRDAIVNGNESFIEEKMSRQPITLREDWRVRPWARKSLCLPFYRYAEPFAVRL
jgi:hypothetical protein